MGILLMPLCFTSDVTGATEGIIEEKKGEGKAVTGGKEEIVTTADGEKHIVSSGNGFIS